MPELPELLYMQHHLQEKTVGSTIVDVVVKQPVVVRNALDQAFEQAIRGRKIGAIGLNGPFLVFGLSGSLDLILNLMLMGRLQHQQSGEKGEAYLCFSLLLDDGSCLNLCDEQKMAKAYLVRESEYTMIPKYLAQGVDILSPDFTFERFTALASKHTRKQVRVFINDHTILSAIGNAYADEILFEARIHPKTLVARLTDDEIRQLYNSIRSVIQWGIRKVEEAQQPIHIKVRDHMRVRWRRGEPCVRCGTTIRREGVRGYDVFFCPQCQTTSRKLFLDWTKATRQ